MRRPRPPRDPRSQDHTETRITLAGLGGERLPQIFHLHKLFISDPSPSPDPGKGGKEKVRMTFSSVPDGAISSGAHLGETAFHFKLCQAQKPEAQPSKKQELGEARFQRRGDGLGTSPRLFWVSCLLPGGASGPSQPHQPGHQRAQGLRNQAVYSASSGVLQNPKDSTFWSSHLLGPSSKGVEVPRQHRGAHFSEPLWPARVLRTTGSLASNKQGQLLKVTAVGWWSPWEGWRHYTHPGCYFRI